MAWLDEEVSAQFAKWETRGRGWKVWPYPVAIEPPFVPFAGYAPNFRQFHDDGRRTNPLTSALTRWGLLMKRPQEPPPPEPEPESEPPEAERSEVIELQLSFPDSFAAKIQQITPLLIQSGLCREPIAFEILGTSESVRFQIAAAPSDVTTVRRQLKAIFPELVVTECENNLAESWPVDGEALIVECGLAHEFVYPLARQTTDPHVGILAALEELASGEIGIFQVLFQSAENPWTEHFHRAVTEIEDKPLFRNRPELAKLVQEKASSPLFAAVVRIAVQAADFDRVLSICRDMAGALRLFAARDGNELVPLENSDYPFEAHLEDLILRRSRRPGMLLNCEELTGFVHLPTTEIRTRKLERQRTKTKAAPLVASQSTTGLLLGHNTHAGRTVEVRLSTDQRVNHAHIIGGSGTGKSTLLFNMIRGDIENGEGVGVLDPHGDLISRILGIIPPERIEDVVLIDASDEEYSVGFNILSAHNDREKTLLASDLTSVFRRLSESWGDQMGTVLQNGILAFLESDQGGTLADLRRFLIEPAFRERFLKTVRDPDIVYFWRKTFTQLTGNKSIGPVLVRLATFLTPKPIRYIVSQQANRIDFKQILDTGKIFLAKLPQGVVGAENSFLLGSLLVTKFQQTAMARQDQEIESRRQFFLYVDEFQNFITPSMAEILTGARKYRMGLILAHQELRQLERGREVASAVMSNPYTRIIFRVGDADARGLEHGLSFFEARDLQNLEKGEAICRVEKADGDFNLSIPFSSEQPTDVQKETRQKAIATSRAKYATPRAEVEAALLAKLQESEEEPAPAKAKTSSPSVRKAAEQKAAEVQKPTSSEKDEQSTIAEATSATPVIPERAPEPKTTGADLSTTKPVPGERGIGGHQHNIIRERIEVAARSLGFYTHREKPTQDGRKIDVALERTGEVIACEISIMTTVDHEVGNVQKCLKAGCVHIAVICTTDARLAKIRQAVAGCLNPEDTSRVGYYLPDQFIVHLESLKPSVVPTEPSERRLGKYNVKRRASKRTPEERKAQEDGAHRIIAQTMRSKPAD